MLCCSCISGGFVRERPVRVAKRARKWQCLEAFRQISRDLPHRQEAKINRSVFDIMSENEVSHFAESERFQLEGGMVAAEYRKQLPVNLIWSEKSLLFPSELHVSGCCRILVSASGRPGGTILFYRFLRCVSAYERPGFRDLASGLPVMRLPFKGDHPAFGLNWLFSPGNPTLYRRNHCRSLSRCCMQEN